MSVLIQRTGVEAARDLLGLTAWSTPVSPHSGNEIGVRVAAEVALRVATEVAHKAEVASSRRRINSRTKQGEQP